MLENHDLTSRQAVSFLIPIYNGSRYIKSMQAHLNTVAMSEDQIIVVNDGSSDDSWRLIKSWESLDKRVLAVQNPKKGLSNALNLGLGLALHNWVARIDIDDAYHLNRITAQLSLAKPDVGAIFSDYDLFNERRRMIGVIASPLDSDATSISLVSSRRTPHPVAILNRDACMDVGGYIQDHFPAEDLSLWLRLSRNSRLVSTPQVLLHYRISENSISSTRKLEMTRMKDFLLRTICVNPTSILNSTNRFEEILASYDEITLSSERKFLFLMDLRKLGRLNQANFESHIVRFLKTDQGLQNLISGGATSFQRGVRRKILKKFNV